MAEAQSVVLVPLLAEGEVIGLLGAADKPGGFTDGDVQILSTFAGPVATFLRSGRASTASAGRRRGSSGWPLWSGTWRPPPDAPACST